MRFGIFGSVVFLCYDKKSSWELVYGYTTEYSKMYKRKCKHKLVVL